jgi:hypothetical protein
MKQTIRNWLPSYCQPDNFLPSVQETVVLFSRRPYLFSDFVGRALAFLQTDSVKKMGFVYDPETALPCKWKCSDECLFGVDLAIYAFTGRYPFDKGKIGGHFNEASVTAATHHSPCNIDFGGAHVGYIPGPNGGDFGHIVRPLRQDATSTDCGYLMGLMAPFKAVYDDACKNILLHRPDGYRVQISVPNEFLRPSWSSEDIKLLVDIERLCAGVVPYDVNKPHTHKMAGRSLFYASDDFLAGLESDTANRFSGSQRRKIGTQLTDPFFHIFDSKAQMDNGVLKDRFLPYMKYILASPYAPYPLKAAVTSANIENNKLTDCVRTEQFRHCSFASFSGVFIDLFDPEVDNYINLFQPIGISIKVPGRTREYEISAAEVHHEFSRIKPVEPIIPLDLVLGHQCSQRIGEQFTFNSPLLKPRPEEL